MYSLIYVAFGNSAVAVDQWLIPSLLIGGCRFGRVCLQTLDVAFFVNCFAILIGLCGLNFDRFVAERADREVLAIVHRITP